MGFFILPVATLAFTTAPSLAPRPSVAARSSSLVADAAAAADTAATVANMDPQTLYALGGAAVAVLGGGYAYQNQGNSKEVLAPAPKAPPKATKKYPLVGGSGGPHQFRGPWPKPPVREIWVPPPGWEPPRKPVQSWYDRGERLKPAQPPAPPPAPPVAPKNAIEKFFEQLQGGFTGETQPSETSSSSYGDPTRGWGLKKRDGSRGGKGGPHRMAGPWPKPPQRELWKPPKGWTPPSPPPPVTVAQAAAFFAANPSVDEEEKKAFLKSQGVSDFVIAQASCTATGMEKTVAGHP